MNDFTIKLKKVLTKPRSMQKNTQKECHMKKSLKNCGFYVNRLDTSFFLRSPESKVNLL